MNTEEKLQHNIDKSTGLHALRKIGTIVEEENRSDAATAHSLRRILRYGWIPLLLVCMLVAYLTGVY